MKSPKKPSKEPSLPSQDEYRRFNVLQEELISKFRTFGESLSSVREDVNSMKPKLEKLDKLSEDMEIVRSAVRTNGQDIRALKDAVKENTEAIHAVQTDLKNINQRVEVVEAKLAS